MNITQDPKYKIFIRRKGQVKKSSIDKYTQDLTYYTISTNQSLTDLIDEARLEQKTIEEDEERQVYNHLEEFKEYLENDREMSDYTIMNCIKTVKTFYNRFKIDTSEFEFTAYPETFYVNVDDLPGQVDIQLILTDANKKYRALITFLASTGMNISDALRLTVNDFLEAYNYKRPMDEHITFDNYLSRFERGSILTWRSTKRSQTRQKTGRPWATFSSPESSKLILDYLRSDPPESANSPLFQNDIHIDRPLSYGSARKYMIYLNEKAGFKDKRLGSYHFITLKSLRTYFATVLENAKIQEKFIRMMMGHSQGRIRQSYHKLNIALLKEEYIKAIDYLTFIEIPVVIDKTAEQEARIKQLEYEREQDRIQMEMVKEEIRVMKMQNEGNKAIEERRKKD